MNPFMNPLSSVCNTTPTKSHKPSYYNCILKDYSIDDWICVGPYNNPDDASALQNINDEDPLKKSKTSMLIVADGYISDRLDIKRKIIKYTFPIITMLDSTNSTK
jgi:hypothetical protein